jgi:hypothetical protein
LHLPYTVSQFLCPQQIKYGSDMEVWKQNCSKKQVKLNWFPAKNRAAKLHVLLEQRIEIFTQVINRDTNEAWLFAADYWKKPKYQILSKSVQWESCYSMRTDGEADMTKLSLFAIFRTRLRSLNFSFALCIKFPNDQ